MLSFYYGIFDGFWLDMNEISNFCHGICPDAYELEPKQSFYSDKLYYIPGARDLDTNTLPMDA
jgi:hypothetical protein